MKTGLKITVTFAAAIAMSSFVSAGASEQASQDSTSTIKTSPITTQVAELGTHKSASICAMDLSPLAQNIYYDVSPKVANDSNLRKLVEKNVRAKLFKRTLTLSSARENAEAAGMCLKILKQQS